MSKRGFDDMAAGGDTTGDNDVKPAIPVDEEQYETDRVEPYDASVKEILPHSPVYTEDFEKLDKGVADLIRLLADPIQEAKFRNGVVNGLLDEISDRTKGGFQEDVRVAFIGGMKAGKSALINSLLSIGMIARQGDAGGSCTWVVQDARLVRTGSCKIRCVNIPQAVIVASPMSQFPFVGLVEWVSRSPYVLSSSFGLVTLGLLGCPISMKGCDHGRFQFG
ncbi:hypothetical protein D0860_00355 [Hortaea werneckii]|uniref:Uncharacterized protein n=1 Tax=Hortaea werneckii TaxID=91943 RepID=A0A3M7HWS1_HORWE|nr:hypothetical protein D0860_00355 [Hortaea werneckii]